MVKRAVRINPNNAEKEMLDGYRAFIEKVNEEAEKALREAGETVLETTAPLVPVQYGSLLQSGRTEAERTSDGARVHVSFGGDNYKVTPTPNAPAGIVFYAIEAHEVSSSPLYLKYGSDAAFSTVQKRIIDALKKVAK